MTEITALEEQYDSYFNELYAPDGHIGFRDIEDISCYYSEEGGEE